MTQSIFQVRPQDAGKGWAIDEYDGRDAWQSTYSKNAKGEPMDKQEAQRRVFQLRRKALNSAKTETPVNKAEVRRGGLYCTHSEALESGFCPDCEQTVNLLPPECSICRGRHGSEVQHACE